MKNKLFQNNIYVKKSRLHGFGVFAGKTIRKGEKIEECYHLLTKGGDVQLDDYYFDADGKYTFILGFGSIYNHCDNPNADYVINKKTKIATFTAIRTIHKDEEIFVSYGDDWFKTRGFKPKKLRISQC